MQAQEVGLLRCLTCSTCKHAHVSKKRWQFPILPNTTKSRLPGGTFLEQLAREGDYVEAEATPFRLIWMNLDQYSATVSLMPFSTAMCNLREKRFKSYHYTFHHPLTLCALNGLTMRILNVELIHGLTAYISKLERNELAFILG